MDSSVSPEDEVWFLNEIWFLRVCHHISNAVYNLHHVTLATNHFTPLASIAAFVTGVTGGGFCVGYVDQWLPASIQWRIGVQHSMYGLLGHQKLCILSRTVFTLSARSSHRTVAFMCDVTATCVRTTVISDYQLLNVCPSVSIEQLGSHWTNFHEIWYLSIFFFRKSSEKSPVSLKFGKNKGYFTWRPKYVYGNISLNSCQNGKYFSQEL